MSQTADERWIALHGRKASPRPFLKWAGGKTQLLKLIEKRLPRKFKAYHEPFVGSGAVYFYLHREKRLRFRAQLSDVNPNLMDAWQALQTDVDGVIEALRVHRNEHDYFYEVRAQDPGGLSLPERAARMIFLNRTCYNGLYRENSQGQFNVPYGRYKRPTLLDEANLRAVSEALKAVDLHRGHFRDVVDRAEEGDFVYLDPPYQPRSPTSYFTAYHKDGFVQADQETLAEVIKALHAKGVQVMLSNSETDFTVGLYDKSHLKADIVKARRNINRNGHARGEINELIVRNYER